jgi:hypothetical protein
MKVVHKYPLTEESQQSIEMPDGAEILTARIQDGALCIWALVDPEQPIVKRLFTIAPTGQEVVGIFHKYIGQIVHHGPWGELVGHLFEVNRR